MAVLPQLTKETASINLSFYSSGMTEDFIQSARQEEPHKETMEGYAVANINPVLLQFFTEHCKAGAIGLVGTRDTIGMAIREAQSEVTSDYSASRWSHCFIFGDMRLDRREGNGGLTRSPYLFESDLKVDAFKPQLRNGAQENWIGKWCKVGVGGQPPLDDRHVMYCSSFVRYCYKDAGRDFLDGSVSVSNTTPEDVARAGQYNMGDYSQ